MDMTVLDERKFSEKLRAISQKEFLKMIDSYEKMIAPGMRSQGFKRINQKERTVTFSFGEMTFSRSRWKKGDTIRIPVDEKLGLQPRARFSQELLYQLTLLANYMPYRKVVSVMEGLKGIYVTKNSVQRALQVAGELLAEREEYRFLAEPKKNQDRVKPKILYIEGDGVWVKQSGQGKEGRAAEISHFVVHTGSQVGGRKDLKDKREVVSTQHKKAKESLLDMIYNNYDVTPETVIVTNSDGGSGYSPAFFKELVSTFKPGSHFHFWDAYHVNQALKKNLRPFPAELTARAFRALQQRNKPQLRTVLETAESLIESADKLENFQRFKRYLLRNFKYTESPGAVGLPSSSIGIMESQHRKITYRMKNRGMYWSQKGAETMSQVIVLDHAGELRDLFFGSWRIEYERIKALDSVKVRRLLSLSGDRYSLPKVSLSRGSTKVLSLLKKK